MKTTYIRSTHDITGIACWLIKSRKLYTREDFLSQCTDMHMVLQSLFYLQFLCVYKIIFSKTINFFIFNLIMLMMKKERKKSLWFEIRGKKEKETTVIRD